MAEYTGAPEQGHDPAYNQRGRHDPSALSPECALDAKARKHGRDERDHVERHAWGPGLLDQRHECPPHPVKRRGGAEADEQKQQTDAAEPEDLPPALGRRDTQRGEDHDRQAEVLRVKLERVRAPVRVPRTAHEVLEEELRDMVPWDGE